MTHRKIERQQFNPDEVPVVGSLGILALGDIGFEAWRKVKIKNNLNQLDEGE